MKLKNTITEFKAMLGDCEGDIPKLTRLLRNRLRLNQESLGALTGVHRNAIVRLENGRCDNPVNWLRELFFVLLTCGDKALHKDVVSLRDHAKKKTSLEITEENSGLFKDFMVLHGASGGSVPELSKSIRKEYNITQEDLAGLLGTDRTAVTHLEGNKHKYPERLLADLYFSFLQLNEPELRGYILTLRLEKVKQARPGGAGKGPVADIRPEEPESWEVLAREPEAKYPEDRDEPVRGTGEKEASAAVGDIENPPAVSASKTDSLDEEAKLRRYGFRTRQELDNAMRSEELTLEEKRRLALIDVLWTDDLKRKETLKFVRSQMQAVKAKIMRELFDRTNNTQAVFIRAANSWRKGLSIAEISQEHNGYLSLPFCRLWEREGFDPARFMAWKPSEKEVYEIYKDYEPEFKTNSLEYRFRPKKNPPSPIEDKENNLNVLLKEWFPLLAEEISE